MHQQMMRAKVGRDVLAILAIVVAVLAAVASAAAQQHQQQPQGVFPPFFGRNFTQIVQWWGYPCEEHRAQTADGYILTLFRIPPKHGGGLKRPPVLLQHGLLDSSFTYCPPPSFPQLSWRRCEGSSR
jgi:hypothetical protein